MSSARILDREEYIEQAYFFRTLRDRSAENLATQDILLRIDQEILATTRLPFAIQFLATELKHSGLLSTGFRRLNHYFTAYQAYIVENTETENHRFSLDLGLQVLQHEAEYRANNVTPAGLFVYQLEVISRNRLGYDEGLDAMAEDPLFDQNWRDYFKVVRGQLGLIDFADLVYVRSDYYVVEQRRQQPDYEPPVAPLFGEKEGRIARANRGRDPLYLFAALQRQLGYPVVPRPKPREDLTNKMETALARIRDLEKRVKLLEREVSGQLDLKDLTELGKPDLLADDEE